jgi:hypothetical protein
VDHAVDRQIDGELIYHIKTELSDNVGDIGPHKKKWSFKTGDLLREVQFI